VLDLSRFIFGPLCTQMLADMGADIIKVEPIGIGDPARLAGIVSINGVSTSFLARNRNKCSTCLDLRKPAGQEVALRLVDRCDVLIHNFRPDVMPRLGLDPKRVRERTPGLIYCSLSGYGQTGPRADWPGQDLLVQAMSGIISTTGWDDGPPVAVGAYMADVAGALTAAYGVLTALYARSQYGIGQEIEVSLLDSMIAFQAMETVSFLNSTIVPRKSGSGHWLLPQPYGVYHTKDKDLAVNAQSNDWWGCLVRAPAFAHLGADPRLVTPASR
jgi:crotonobetainyl-CoA:carnitine CoA-transferase CaiB-like acyl-CoA transferase